MLAGRGTEGMERTGASIRAALPAVNVPSMPARHRPLSASFVDAPKFVNATLAFSECFV